MRIEPLNGKYVVAVSGGVDSVALLDLLQRQSIKNPNLDLIVAHFDHGIRGDSNDDRQFVENLAKNLSLKFYYEEGHLGDDASEQQARDARYSFLKDIVKKESAAGIVTAHHQDDQIETAIINIVRGTGRKGLSSLSSSGIIHRPLLDYSKADITNYARKNKLSWREDPTNQDIKYLRNYIRHMILPKLNQPERTRLLSIISKQAKLNAQIDKELANILNLKAEENKLPRLWLSSLDSSLSREVLATWLRQNYILSFNKATLSRLSVDLKTLPAGKHVEVFDGWRVVTTRDNLALEHIER